MTDTALVLIDIQQGFDDPKWGKRNNPRAEENCALLLNFFRKNHLPLYHIQHLSTEENSPLRPDRPGREGTDLKKILEKDGMRLHLI